MPPKGCPGGRSPMGFSLGDRVSTHVGGGREAKFKKRDYVPDHSTKTTSEFNLMMPIFLSLSKPSTASPDGLFPPTDAKCG